MLRHCVPHTDLPSMTGGNQLTPNEEKRINRHAETEHTFRRYREPFSGHLPKSFIVISIVFDARALFWFILSFLSPISLPLPPSWMLHRMILLSEDTATILSLSSWGPPTTFAFSATRSMAQSRYGLENTCCHPEDSFILCSSRKTTEKVSPNVSSVNNL